LSGTKLTDLFPVNVLGFQSHRDEFAIDFDREQICSRLSNLYDRAITVEQLAEKYPVTQNDEWSFTVARTRLTSAKNIDRAISQCTYRPFDNRWCLFDEVAMDRPRKELKQHVRGRETLVLNVPKIVKVRWNHAFVSRYPSSAIALDINGSYNIPIYLFDLEADNQLQYSSENRSENLSASFKKEWLHKHNTNCPPVYDMMSFAYAVLHSRNYRERYSEFLKNDFPYIPTGYPLLLFNALVGLGKALVSLHLVQSPSLDTRVSKFVGIGTEVIKPGWTSDSGGTVWLDATGTKAKTNAGTHGFVGVTEEVWNFHIGGYQVCEKWLKDRKGRTLSADDIAHYHKIVVALSETIRIMKEIDEVIEQHGGWPGAFHTSGDSSSAPIEYKHDERTPKAAEDTLFED
jgi:hypothetical protein